MTQTEIYYDRVWARDTIEQIHQELVLLDELSQNINDIRTVSLELEDLYCQVFPIITTLKRSLQKTSKSIEVFMDGMEKTLANAKEAYEIGLEKKSELFSDV